MKKYNSYKYSGVEWIGYLPKEWDYARIKHYSESKTGTTPSRDKEEYWIGGDIPWMSSGEINQKQVSIVSEFVTEQAFRDTSLKLFPINTVMIAMNGQGKTKGTVGILKIETTCNQSLTGFTFTCRVFPEFVYYYLDSRYHDIRGLVGEDREGLSSQLLKNLFIPLPSLEEQIKIARYLDSKTSQIDKLIADKEKLIELLNEERTATINQVVTRGLNPDVAMKDSGVEWLGEVPEHWEIKKLKYLCSVISEKNAGLKPQLIVALENIESWTGRITDSLDINHISSDLGLFRQGDVLFSKLRPYLAKGILAGQDGACVGEMLVLRSSSEMLPEFLFRRMLSEVFISVIDGSTFGTKMPRASWDKCISHMEVPICSLDEQKGIIEYINTQERRIDSLLCKIKHEIHLLKEYKTALISEVVTGKVDVRDEIIAETPELVS